MKARTIIEYILAAIIVLILGSLAGWYFFLRTQTQTTTSQGLARGYGAEIPVGNVGGGAPSASSNPGGGGAPAQTSQPASAPSGTFFSRLWSTITGNWGSTQTSAGLPFGDNTSPFSSGAQPNSPEGEQEVQRPPELWHLEVQPIAGQRFVGSGTNVRVRYVERASGYVFEANPATGQVIRLTNTLMPKIYESLLTENGHVFERSLDASGSITTFVGSLSTSTDSSNASSSAQSLAGLYLAKSIVDMSAHPRSGALFYLVKDQEGIAGVSADWNGEKRKTIFSSIIMSWRPTVLEDGRIILVQAAADSVPGYAYILQSNGTLSPLLGPVPGLTVRVRPVSGTGTSSAILWGQSVRGVMSLFVQVAPNATAVELPIKTIADKCAWSTGRDLVAYCGVPQGSAGQNFLDDWYRGAAHSSDALWRIDASAGSAEMVYTPPSNTSIDIENASVDSGGNYITFTNAADKSLWLLRLTK